MEELNNLENMNFSGSPEYIDVFNDGISTAAEITPTPTVCPNGQATTSCTTCNISIGATACTGTYSSPKPPVCICNNVTLTGSPQTNYTVYYTCIIKVSSKLGNGASANVGNTDEGYGHTLKLKYISGNTNSIFTKNYTYDFKCKEITINYTTTTTAFTYTYSATTTDPQYYYSGLTCYFNIVNMDGHVFNTGDTYTLNKFINVRAIDPDATLSPVTYERFGTISLSAKTYSISYDSDTNISSSAFEKIIKNNIKIGTKFSVYDTDKTKTATTGNNSAYAYSVGYCTEETPNYNFKPFHRFFINTSAETICVKQERCGESYETTIDLNPSSYIPILPPMQTSGKLATLKTLYDSSTGLGITSFQKMFSNEISSKGNMVLTPNQYQKLNIQDNTFNGIVYGYTKPTIYYSASTNSQNYCLKINDISTFDRYIYLATSTGMTNPNGTNVSTQGIYVHNNFTAYKNYPLTNVKNEVEWTESGDEKKYFTFYL